MRTSPDWHGVRLRPHWTGADPDASPRSVFVPTGWDTAAATALAALAPGGSGPLRLPLAAAAWIGRFPAPLGAALHRLVLRRQAAPDAALWQGRNHPVRFVLNLPGFLDPQGGFDLPGYRDAIAVLAEALALAVPASAPPPSIGFADLAGLLAALGLRYDSEPARETARALAALLRARLAGPKLPDAPALPATTPIPGLAEAARAACAAPQAAGRVVAALAIPGAPEALLGAETGGLAPAFSPLDSTGQLTRAARAWLAATDQSPEQALAAALSGAAPFPAADAAAEAAMEAAVAPFLLLPHRARPEPAAAPAARRDLPARRAGYTQRASIGGHRLYLGTGQYADGSLGEISVALHKENPAFRGLMDSFCTAVSLGLQHGVPLAEFVDAFVQTRFGPAGAVEGDPAVPGASSVVDYIFRHLAATYLGRTDLPAPPAEDVPAPAPLLPLDLPSERSAARRRLRVVG